MKRTIRVNSIIGGQGPTQYINIEGGYNAAQGVDPDFPAESGDKRASGIIVPTGYSKFSGANVDSFVNWLITNIKDEKVYGYQQNGKVVSYDENLANEALVGTPTSGAGNGGNYYNNYLYFMTPTNVSRYGPLNGTPTLTNTFWTGLSLAALTNTTYPTIRNVVIPNHAGHVHGDNCLYFGDVISGQGVIHKIKTTKTTVEGDTNNGSAYNALDLPFGFYPVDIESSGTDLAIVAIQTTSDNLIQGNAHLFLWNTIDDSFFKAIPLPDPLVTAVVNVNGILMIFTGDGKDGVRISKYIGGNSVIPVLEIDEGAPPFAGAVDAKGNKLFWGAYQSYPTTAGVVHALGSKKSNLPQGWHTPVKCTSAGANPMVTAVKAVEQDSTMTPKVIAAWGDDSGKGIDKYSSSATLSSVMRIGPFNIGEKFSIDRIRIPLAKSIAANMQIIPKVYIDDESTTKTLATVNATNYNGLRKVIYKGADLQDYIGENNFILELAWGGTVQLPVLLPILVDIDIYEDE
ncbi:MAG: hypothetical protein WCW77_00115 [Patescibacteria group bacterium]|jgi:hypothetical protein